MSQTLIDAAKAPVIAYNNKDWDAVKRVIGANYLYDEVATHRVVRGVADVIALWQGWAAAFPDSKATFEATHVSGNTVVLEVTWRGTHTGALRTPGGDIAATGRKIEIRACQVCDVADGTAQRMRQYFDMATLFTQLGVSAAAA
jgi:steroid delta-isomerase-like uncharacterized protein